MVRISKQNERRNQSPRKRKPLATKTGPKSDKLPKGFKEHENALPEDHASKLFIPKIKTFVKR